MTATYETEIEALNAISDQISALDDKIVSLSGNVQGINSKMDSVQLKLDSVLNLTQGLRGAVVDVKNQPTDVIIERIYVGDVADKRRVAAREISGLLSEGYRPYQTFGISEDLARVLFVKYPEPNDADVANAEPVEP